VETKGRKRSEKEAKKRKKWNVSQNLKLKKQLREKLNCKINNPNKVREEKDKPKENLTIQSFHQGLHRRKQQMIMLMKKLTVKGVVCVSVVSRMMCICGRWLHESCVDFDNIDANGHIEKLCPLC